MYPLILRVPKQDAGSTSSRRGSRRPSSNVMMMEKDQIFALEQQHLLRGAAGSNDGTSSTGFPPPSANTLSPASAFAASPLSANTPVMSTTAENRGAGSIPTRSYSTALEQRKYSSSIDPYRKLSSVSGYGYGRQGYVAPNAGVTSKTSMGGSKPQIPMIDDN